MVPMATLYLRNVPDDVVDALGALATHAGMSVSAFAVRELTEASRRAVNAELLDGLADHKVSAQSVVEDIRAARAR